MGQRLLDQSFHQCWMWVWRLVFWSSVVTSVTGICVWQGGGGFRLACGFKQSGLLRMRSLGGLKGWAGAGFTIGDEDGFKDSLTNTESAKGRVPKTVPYSNQYQTVPSQQITQLQLNQGQRFQHESENLQKRASLWNSWKWPSIIKKNGPNRENGAVPQRMGPVHHMYHHGPMPPYPPRVSPPMYPRPIPMPHYPLASMPYPSIKTHHQVPLYPPIQYPGVPPRRYPAEVPPIPDFQRRPGDIPGYSAVPDITSLLKGTSDETESQIETVLKALRIKAEKQKKKEAQNKKPYGLRLLENSENFGTKFQISENSVPASDDGEGAETAVTGYDTNLFPDIYFTSTTPRDRLKKILETDNNAEEATDVKEESTTEAILRKLRLKKIKLLKKGHKLKFPKGSKPPLAEPLEETTRPDPTTTVKLTTSTRKVTSSPSTTTVTTVGTTTTTTTPVPTTTPRPKAPPSMRTSPTVRPDYGDSYYSSVESEQRPSWKQYTRRPTTRPYPPIAENPLILSGKWKDIYNPRFPPDHELNRGKLELLAAALTTTSQRPESREYEPNFGYDVQKDSDEREDFSIRPNYYRRDPYPKRFDSGYHNDDRYEYSLPTRVRVDSDNGQLVKFDSREFFNLVNRTKSYNDAFYTHFNKTAMQMSENAPNPTPFHYFSAYNQNSSTREPPRPPPGSSWHQKPPSWGQHFSRNDYIPSSTTLPRPLSRPSTNVDQWSGMGRQESQSIEDFRPRLDHSSETGDLLRQKSMTYFTINRGTWNDRPTVDDVTPNFVTDDNFQFYKTPKFETPRPTPPPMEHTTSSHYYFSSTPSFSEWKNYVGSVSGISSTTVLAPPPTAAALIEPSSTSRQQGPSDAQPQLHTERGKNRNETKLSPIKVTERKKGTKIKSEVKKSKGKSKAAVTTTTVPSTTTSAAAAVIVGSNTRQSEISVEYSDSDEETVVAQGPLPEKGMKPKHPKKPAAAAFLPVSSPSQMSRRPYVAPEPPVRMEPPPQPTYHSLLPSQNLGPPPPPSDFATSHLNDFGLGKVPQPLPIQLDWNLHPLPTEPPVPSQTTVKEVTLQTSYTVPPQPPTPNPQFQQRQPPMPPHPTYQSLLPSQNLGPPPPPSDFATSHLNDFGLGKVPQPLPIQLDWKLHLLPTEPPVPSQTTVKEVTLQTSYTVPHQSPTPNPQFQQRQSPMPPQPPPWTRHGPHPPPHSPPHMFHGPIPYPPPRSFSQQYPAPPFNGYPKPIRHMVPGRTPMGLEPPPAPHPPHGHDISHSPPLSHSPPMGVHSEFDMPPSFPVGVPNHPRVRPIQATLLPPPPPPPQIVPSTQATVATTTTTTTTTTEKPQPIKIKEEKADERDILIKALQTLTRAKSDMLHSVVNEKYGADVSGVVKVATEVPKHFETTKSTTTTTMRPTTRTTTTTKPTTTMSTRVVFDQIPEKFVPLVNYVKKLKVPTYENDKVQIDYFNFKSEEEKPKAKIPVPSVLGLNFEDLALLASTNQPVQVPVQPDYAKQFEEMLRHALASKVAPTLPPIPTSSPTPTPLVQTLAQMGIIQKLHDRNVTSNQIETLKKLIELNKFQERMDFPPPLAPPTPFPESTQLFNNFRHILNHLPPTSSSALRHRISHVDPSISVLQHLHAPPNTTPKPYTGLTGSLNGPTLQALKAIALNRIQNVQPAPQIHLPQQTASEETDDDQITVDLSPLLGLAEFKKPDPGKRSVKVRNAPKSYYPGDRILPFDGGKDIFTDFQCEKQEFFPGLYGDQSNSCKVFHLCAKTDAGFLTKTFRCPQGTVFDQEVLRCNWSLYVTCKGVEEKYMFNKYLSQSFQFLKSLGEFSASVQPKG